MVDERRGSMGRWLAWWRRVVDHFRGDDALGLTEAPRAVGPDVATARPGSAAGAASLDQLLLRAADRRAREHPPES
jgi:hypothetical protein